MQYNYHNIIFDLDGTLINSGPGIIHAVQYALKKYGINETDMTVLKSFVGPPLNQQFINCYNFSHEQSLEAVKYFREYYTDKGILENEVYEQIPELLKTLAENGLKLLIASSKPEKFAQETQLLLQSYCETIPGFAETYGDQMQDLYDEMAYQKAKVAYQRGEEVTSLNPRSNMKHLLFSFWMMWQRLIGH